MRKHVIYICVITIILLVMFVCFNWIIDPYKIWDVPEIPGVNTSRGLVQTHQRIQKTIGLSRHQGNTFILGTSRSNNGLDPTHPALGGKAVNMAISGQPYRETRKLFDLLASRKKHSEFIIGLDFFEANNYLGYPPDFTEDNYSNFRDMQLLLSASTLSDSTLVLTDSALSKFSSELTPTETNSRSNAFTRKVWEAPRMLGETKGLHLMSDPRNEGGHRAVFKYSERFFSSIFYLPQPSCSFSLHAINGKNTHMEEIRSIISRAHREHISIKFFISPSHARQWETLAAAGLWGLWEEWKRDLVKMNEVEAQLAGQPPFPLWDFSGYNTISLETVPPLGDTNLLMHWYYDSSHYTPATGDMLLDRILYYNSPERIIPDDFGVLLSSNNLDAHLANIRATREHYRLTHPEDIAEIETMAREVAKTKRCQPVQK